MKTVVAGAIGECVHVAGVSNFLRLAEQAGWRTIFLGPAAPIAEIREAAKREHADLIGFAYRLAAETGVRLLGDFAEAADELHEIGVRFAFGGTPRVVAQARKIALFEVCFDGSESTDQVIAFLKGQGNADPEQTDVHQTIIDRIHWKSPYPLIRHHFGRRIFPKRSGASKKLRNPACRMSSPWALTITKNEMH